MPRQFCVPHPNKYSHKHECIYELTTRSAHGFPQLPTRRRRPFERASREVEVGVSFGAAGSPLTSKQLPLEVELPQFDVLRTRLQVVLQHQDLPLRSQPQNLVRGALPVSNVEACGGEAFRAGALSEGVVGRVPAGRSYRSWGLEECLSP